jgi:hypothetical protein
MIISVNLSGLYEDALTDCDALPLLFRGPSRPVILPSVLYNRPPSENENQPHDSTAEQMLPACRENIQEPAHLREFDMSKLELKTS